MFQSPLFETISIIEGKIQQMEYHQKRYEKAMIHYFGVTPPFKNLDEIILPHLSTQLGKMRCKIIYTPTEYRIELSHYMPKEIQRFRCVYVKEVDYKFKYLQREIFNQFPMQVNEELILVQQGYITDCTIGNLLFKREGNWYSPNHYLLYGTQLDYLVDKGKVQLIDIHLDNLFDYEQIMLINALNPFNLARALPINTTTISL